MRRYVQTDLKFKGNCGGGGGRGVTGINVRGITSECWCTVVLEYGNNHHNEEITPNFSSGYRSGALTLNGLISFNWRSGMYCHPTFFFLYKSCFYICRGGSRTAVTSKVKLFVITVNGCTSDALLTLEVS